METKYGSPNFGNPHKHYKNQKARDGIRKFYRVKNLINTRRFNTLLPMSSFLSSASYFKGGIIMKTEKKRLSLFVPAFLYNRLDTDAKVYGVTKTTIVQNALLSYYRAVDSKYKNQPQSRRVSSGLWNTGAALLAARICRKSRLTHMKNAIMQATRTQAQQCRLSPR